MPEPETKSSRLPRGIIRNTSVATRLSLVVVVVALVSLAVTSVVGLQRGGELADGLLRDRLTAIGAARAYEVERYLSNVERIALAQAVSPSTAEAIATFTAAYGELQSQQPSSEDRTAVDDFYLEVVAPQLSEVRGRPVTASSLIPQSPAGVHLQANYVVRGGDDAGLIEDAGDGSTWSEIHAELHQSFVEVATQAGADDLYLIEPTSNTIVYSTAKNIDFATSLRTGPQSGTSLAATIAALGLDPSEGDVRLTDFTSYTAAGGEPSGFAAASVVVDGVSAGFVALRFGADALTAITTDDFEWTGQGETGESFLVAQDNLMRSDSRDFIEDQSTFLESVTLSGTASDEQVRLMEQFGTTVLFQPVDDDAVDAAIEGSTELAETTDLFGTDVLQARRAIDVEGLQWGMITEVAKQEIEQPVSDFARNLLIAIALFLVAITFLATKWADRLLSPVRMISTKLRSIRAEGHDAEASDPMEVPDNSATEFVDLADDIDTMLATLDARNADALGRSDERRRLLRRLLPPQAVQRAEAGERNVVEQIAHASIAAIAIRGMGSLLHSGSRDEARSLLDRFVEEVDAMAKQRGLERIRVTGDAYLAGCGTVRPHIDHAARTASFVLDVIDLVGDLSEETGHTISIGAGADSGAVTVGLTGGSGLVYDAWGATVQRAADLARRADDGSALISASTRSQLPSTFDIEPVDSPAGTFVVAGRNLEVDAS